MFDKIMITYHFIITMYVQVCLFVWLPWRGSRPPLYTSRASTAGAGGALTGSASASARGSPRPPPSSATGHCLPTQQTIIIVLKLTEGTCTVLNARKKINLHCEAVQRTSSKWTINRRNVMQLA